MRGHLHMRCGGASVTSSLQLLRRPCTPTFSAQAPHPLPRSVVTAAALHGTNTARISVVHTAQRCFGSTALLCTPSHASSPSTPTAKRAGRKTSRGQVRGGARKASGRRQASTKKRRSHAPTAVSRDESAGGVEEGDVDGQEDPMEGVEGASNPHTGASSSLSKHVDGEASASARAEPGWGLERVDGATGKTSLEDLYDRNLSRIHHILEQPLPPLPQDGSVDPDFFVGFASYSYQLRDQYRAVLARELQVPVKAVRLSVGWSGRFNVKRFGRVQKVCGVCLDREVLTQANDGAAAAAASASGERGASPQALPDAVQERMMSLIADINTQQREDLLQVQLFQASPPIPEVEFALTRQEHRLVYHLHDWLRRSVLRRAVAVVVCGLPPPPSPTTTNPNTAPAKVKLEKETEGAVVHRHFAEWQQRAREVSAGQWEEVQRRWVRLFHRREIVPSVVSLTELATALAVAVARGDVTGVQCESPDGSGEATAVQLEGPLREVVIEIASAAASSGSVRDSEGKPQGTAIERVEEEEEEAAEDATATLHTGVTHRDVLLPLGASSASAEAAVADFSTPAQEEAALRWVRLVYQALLLRETHSAGLAGSGAPSPSATAPVEVALPALFTHGVYAGSRKEVEYLQRNRTAMDAVLLHPHEISFKKKFVSRLRNGHRRLKMEEEAAAPHAD